MNDNVCHPWDYLIVTASNASQAQAYGAQLDIRFRLGLIGGIKRFSVVPDVGGLRIGSGGSTVRCLMEVLRRETGTLSSAEKNNPETWKQILSGLRILILHAGGDSRRLPGYGPCGKLFIPVPGNSKSVLGETLFDRQLPIYLDLPLPDDGAGQTVITTGDVLLFFDPGEVRFPAEGITGLGAWAPPETAEHHGVFRADESGNVLSFFQKPSRRDQEGSGCITGSGLSLLDIGVMNLGPEAAARLLRLCAVGVGPDGIWDWSGPVAEAAILYGLDFYSEIGCAMGTEADRGDYLARVRAAGIRHDTSVLKEIFDAVSDIRFRVNPLSACEFLHFGTMQQLISSGRALSERGGLRGESGHRLMMNSRLDPRNGRISGGPAWVDGCRIESELSLAGSNVVLGADIRSPLSLPSGACLDILKRGSAGSKNPVWFLRLYDIDDDFKAGVDSGAVWFGRPPMEWLKIVGAEAPEVWDPGIPEQERSLWNARLFPEISSASAYSEWLWMLNPEEASAAQHARWRRSERHSAQEIAGTADQDDFFERRWTLRREEISVSMGSYLMENNGLSAEEIDFVWKSLARTELEAWVAQMLSLAVGCGQHPKTSGLERLSFSRIIHTLASAMERFEKEVPGTWETLWPELIQRLEDREQNVLEEWGLLPGLASDTASWCRRAKDAAFVNLSRTIVTSSSQGDGLPENAVREDEIVWGRAPARLDLGGGWTDTPPYSLENGGCVINAAVNLNGQPPIQVYARVIPETEIRIASIDFGTRLAIKTLEELLDYREATSSFGLAKAALALSGFAPLREKWPRTITRLDQMLDRFGGGVELTTLAAIPSGSGLGTSSIMGAVLMSVIARIKGRPLSHRDLFHAVLQLEQELTTGGGWQDQIGGTLPDIKVITSQPGLVPDPQIQAVPADVLDPAVNGGQTLLYYTGMRRLAKNILRSIVGKYLDRNHRTLDTLAKLHAYPPLAADAMRCKDTARFGRMIDLAWRLNKQLDPDSSNPKVEEIFARFEPYMLGAKLLGAGGGGFLLVVCKSPALAVAARKDLTDNPPNPLARFFEFSISRTGLEVSVC